MSIQTNQSFQKLISIPYPLYKVASKKVKKIGLNLSEYIRMLIFLDNKNSFNDTILLDSATEKRVLRSKSEIKKGSYVTIKPGQDVSAFLESLK